MSEMALLSLSSNWLSASGLGSPVFVGAFVVGCDCASPVVICVEAVSLGADQLVLAHCCGSVCVI